MNTTDIIGYIGMAILTYGFFIKDRSRMHFALSVSALILGLYSILISSIPFILLNIVSFFVNAFRFFEFKEKIKKNKGSR